MGYPDQSNHPFRGDEKLTLRLGDPVVVAQAAPEVTAWGPYQFPRLEKLADGCLHVAYHIEADSATAYGLPMGHAVSADEGQSWVGTDAPASPGGLLLPNGDRLLADSERSIPQAQLTLPTPLASVHASFVDYDYYRTPDLPAELAPAWPFLRCAAGQTDWVREWASVDLGADSDLRSVTEETFVIPFFEQDRLRLLPDGSLLTTTYLIPHLGPRHKVIRPFLVRMVHSEDGGRTWRQVGTIPYRPDLEADPLWDARDGFTEPEVQDLPDGSLLALLRTQDGNGNGPMYAARSEDGGASWSCPEVFDDRGVWPQLLRLGEGITLVAYGRPGLFLRATRDPAARSWGERATVLEPGGTYTEGCSYSDLLALDDHRALLVYSSFRHPNAQGQPCKTILCRTVEVA